MDDQAGGLIETATFCKTGDEKRPNIVGLPDFSTQQVCDDDLTKPAAEVTDAVPTFWYARVEFDRLLDPNVEDLIPNIDPDTMQPNGTFTGSLAMTQPVTLKCGGVDVPYDGFYSPSGNNVTWPVGPSLFIQPTDLSVVATSSECEITIKDVVKGKNGNPVDADSVGGGGKFKWQIAPITILGTSPTGDPTAPDLITPDVPLVITFNAFIDAASITPAEVTVQEVMMDCATVVAGAHAAVIALDSADPTSVDIADMNAPATLAWKASTFYLISFTAAADAADVAGGAAPVAGSFCFQTDVAP